MEETSAGPESRASPTDSRRAGVLLAGGCRRRAVPEGGDVPRWRWWLIQGLLFLGAGALFAVAFVFGSSSIAIGAAAVGASAAATVLLFLAWSDRRRARRHEAPGVRRGASDRGP